MNRTVTLYDEDAYRRSFTATVLDCRPGRDDYEIILDQTVFFPQQGGQVSDRGRLGEAFISDVQISDGIIIHHADKPLEPGSKVEGEIDWPRRFDLMQNHTGEHILSGIICHAYGCRNVGFRLAEDNCTVDYDLPLTSQQLEEAERMANQVIWENREVLVSCPSKEQLENLDYRSKKELEGKIRIVEIPGVDVCACCAPHLKHTGEAGLLKIISAEKHKNGVRLYILSGQRAFRALKESQEVADQLVHELSTPREKLPQRVAALSLLTDRLSRELSAVKVQLLVRQIADEQSDPVLFFCRDVLEKDIREVINGFLAEHPEKTCGGFCGSDEEGYRLVLASARHDMKKLAAALRERLGFQGGGSSQMIQGNIRAERSGIEETVRKLMNEEDNTL